MFVAIRHRIHILRNINGEIRIIFPKRKLYQKNNRCWNAVRGICLKKKNRNADVNKKSHSIYAETINEIYNKLIRK